MNTVTMNELEPRKKVRYKLKIFTAKTNRLLTYNWLTDRSEDPTGRIAVILHKRTFDFGLIISAQQVERFRTYRGKVVELINWFRYPKWQLELIGDLCETYGLKPEEAYRSYLQLPKILDCFKFENVLLINCGNTKVGKILEKLDISPEYPLSIPLSLLEQKTGRNVYHYKSMLMKNGATITYKLELKRSLKKMISEFTSTPISPDISLSEKTPKLQFQMYSNRNLLELGKKVRDIVLNQKLQVAVIIPEKLLTKLLAKLWKLPEEYVLTPYERPSVYQLKLFKLALGYPMIVIGTGIILGLPYSKLRACILLAEGDDTHIHQSYPAYNWRDIAVKVSQYSRSELIMMDIMPSIFTLARDDVEYIAQNGEPVKFPQLTLNAERLRAFKEVIVLPLPATKRELLTGRALNIIEATVKRGGRTLIFNYVLKACVIRCTTCSHRPTCPICGTPMSYDRASLKLRCPVCWHSSKLDRCPICQSYNWSVREIDLQRTYRLLERIFGRVLYLDREFQRQKGKVSLLENIKNYRIIIGSKSAVKLPITFDLVLILSLESFFYHSSVNANFNAVYHIVHALYRLKPTGKLVIFEPRDHPIGSTDDIYTYLLNKLQNLEVFLKTELKLRAELKLPPQYALFELRAKINSAEELEKVNALLMSLEELYYQELEVLRVNCGPKMMRAFISLKTDKVHSLRSTLDNLAVDFELNPRNLSLFRRWAL